MMLRADNGFYLTNTSETYSDTGSTNFLETSTGAYLTNAGAWVSVSDRNKKENFTELNLADVLNKVAALPITRWNYKVDEDHYQHIGPMAQDFYATFGLGYNNVSLSATDLASVALASIKELKQRNDELKARVIELEQQHQLDSVNASNASLNQENTELRTRVARLERMVEQLFGEDGHEITPASGGASSASVAQVSFSQEGSR